MKQDLQRSLLWAAMKIRNISQEVQSASVAKSGLPPLAETIPHVLQTSHPERESTVSASMAEARRVTSRHDTDSVGSYGYGHPSGDLVDQFPSAVQYLPPILEADEMDRDCPSRPIPPPFVHSPRQSGSGSPYGQAQSPMQHHHPTRTLPTPVSLQYSPLSSVSGNYAAVPQSAHTAHLQDLQHQISTETSILQTLQKEHRQLLAAFSQSQIRCNVLDKKSQVSDHEINDLTEGKLRLQQQVEALEAQVEELLKARKESHRQSTADGAQWRQIMAMSSQLHMQGADKSRRHRSDRELWEQEKEAMQQRILELETNAASPSTTKQKDQPVAPVPPSDLLTSTSLEVLRREIVRLRTTCRKLELALGEIGGETESIDTVVKVLVRLKQRIVTSRPCTSGTTA